MHGKVNYLTKPKPLFVGKNGLNLRKVSYYGTNLISNEMKFNIGNTVKQLKNIVFCDHFIMAFNTVYNQFCDD